MKLSIILPTYNNEKTLDECLKSIFMQNLDRDEFEVLLIDGGSTDKTKEIAKKYPVRLINNPKRTEEFARIMGVKEAKGEIIGLIDADNILVGEDWLGKMLSPFKDKKISFADTLYYGFRKTDPIKVRYQGLIGGDDPLANYLGLYSRWCYFSNDWTGFPYESEKFDNYLKISLKNKKLVPAMGSNGFLIRKNVLNKFFKNTFIHSDIVYSAINNGYNCFAKVDAYIIHNQPNFFKNKIRRIQRRISSEINIKYNYGINKKTVFFLLLRALLILPIVYDVVNGFIKKPDLAWIFHFPAVYILLAIHLYYNTMSLLRFKKTEIVD